MKGTILAGDGLVIAVNAPSQQDRYNCKVLDITHFRNRKGCFGIICEAFCDAYRIFRVVEIKWPGATNDITAYKQTDLYLCWRSSSGSVSLCPRWGPQFHWGSEPFDVIFVISAEESSQGFRRHLLQNESIQPLPRRRKSLWPLKRQDTSLIISNMFPRLRFDAVRSKSRSWSLNEVIATFEASSPSSSV